MEAYGHKLTLVPKHGIHVEGKYIDHNLVHLYNE